jgi:hypothetical protein
MNELEALQQKVATLEDEVKKIHEQYLLSNVELRRLGIENGSRGVKGAFALIAFIFLVNALVAQFSQGKEVFPALHLIGLGALLCLALVAYFGFIFKFTVGAEVGNGKWGFRTAGNGDI